MCLYCSITFHTYQLSPLSPSNSLDFCEQGRADIVVIYKYIMLLIANCNKSIFNRTSIFYVESKRLFFKWIFGIRVNQWIVICQAVSSASSFIWRVALSSLAGFVTVTRMYAARDVAAWPQRLTLLGAPGHRSAETFRGGRVTSATAAHCSL